MSLEIIVLRTGLITSLHSVRKHAYGCVSLHCSPDDHWRPLLTAIRSLNSRKFLADKCSGPLMDTSPFGFSIAPGTLADSAVVASPARVRVQHSVRCYYRFETPSSMLTMVGSAIDRPHYYNRVD